MKSRTAVIAGQVIVDAFWQVYVIAMRNCCCLLFTAGNKDKAVVLMTSRVDGLHLVLDHKRKLTHVG